MWGMAGGLVMPSHPDRVRANYTCRVCGVSILDGEHEVYRFDPHSGDILVCSPRMIVRNPQRLGVIIGIDWGKQEV